MRQRRQWKVLRRAIACADACAIALLFSLVYISSLARPLTSYPTRAMLLSALAIGTYVVGWLVLLAVYRLYDAEYLLDGNQQYTRIAQASTAGLLAVGLVTLLDGSILLPRRVVLTSWVLSVLSLGVTRFLIRRYVRQLRRVGMLRSRMLIVGAGDDGLAIADRVTGSSPNSVEVIGFLDEYCAIGTEVGNQWKVLGEPLALAQVARLSNATEAIIVPQAVSWESLQLLLQGGADAWGVQRLWLAPAFRDLLTTGLEVHQCGSLPLLSVNGPRIVGLEGVLKRGLDLVAMLVVLPVVAPVCLLIALWLATVRRVAPFKRHQMMGRSRRTFSLLTFTPTPGLRHAHLWRLPALVNVIKGDLSLVGPRPIVHSLGAEYRRWQLMLASVRPGLTGPWWLLSGSGHLSVEAEVGLDLAYIRNYTIWWDIRLLALTARRVLTQAGTVTPPTSAVQAALNNVAPEGTAAQAGGTL